MRYILIFLTLLVLLTGCAKEENTASVSLQDFEMPDMILNNTTYTLSTGEGEPIKIHAKEMKVYLSSDKVLVKDVSFEQLDESGELYISGYAGRGEINTKDKICSFSGQTSLKQHKDNLSIETQSLTFDSRDNSVNSESYVSVSFPGGRLEGFKLYADLTKMSLEMKELFSGEVNEWKE